MFFHDILVSETPDKALIQLDILCCPSSGADARLPLLPDSRTVPASVESWLPDVAKRGLLEMTVKSQGRLLSTVFVDYDNIYLSLRRKSEDAAKAFAKNTAVWLKEIETGRLITPTNGPVVEQPRRIVMNRCYGNPVPRRNATDNSTDMNSFPFVRHNFLRAGFEVIDCPPLTAQLKNSSDIRMVMDVRDYLSHETYFEEFIILSGDADFTPLLHRLRAHARRTVIFSNDHTASPYTAISDGEIRESDLMTFLLDGRLPGDAPVERIEDLSAQAAQTLPSAAQIELSRKEIIAEVVNAVRAASQPVPLEALADRAVRNLGHDKTAGSAWGGMGSFRELLLRALPQGLRVSEQPPYYVFDTTRQAATEAARIEAPRTEARIDVAAPRIDTPRAEATYDRQTVLPPPPLPVQAAPAQAAPAQAVPAQPAPALTLRPLTAQPQVAAAPEQHQQPAPRQPTYTERLQEAAGLVPQTPIQRAPVAAPPQPAPAQPPVQQPAAAAPPAPVQRHAEVATAIQQSIARIHDACQAPPLSPPEYRVLFEVMAQEISSNGLLGGQTLTAIVTRAKEMGVELRRDDARFVLEVVSEADPWFEQGASANLFAGRFRNFVVARCRGQGLNLSADEIDLIEAWFAAGPAGGQRAGSGAGNAPVSAPRAPAPSLQPPQPAQPQAQAQAVGGERWWALDDARQSQAEVRGDTGEDFPRIIRARQRG